eukprot:CAMPEP_0204865826 /NCGR_PEP_ID=MMETSP1348-20121228/13919_1 /ASSEMBLY_ACC=CAM_ASM_000700 /TAXON_ID=215587 /ORGANISM="Aplanochytrium stocchinoi, Strain GSBS06" /LENGTH=442 /DNA_ID=CAMNT_0052017379 /DNA_START=11 /DNA_END=1339 /DNA_ORIENTATION=-
MAVRASEEEKTKFLTTVMVEGTIYDISNFNHPGGSVIRFLSEKSIKKGDAKDGEEIEHLDASEAFREFHQKDMEKVTKYLKSLPKISTKGKDRNESKYKALSKDFLDFRNSLEREGYFKPSLLHVAYRILEIVAMFGVSFLLFSMPADKHSILQPLVILACLINGIAQGRCGWLMHEGGHLSLTGIRKLDITMQEIVYGVGCGMSGGWWRSQHNKHHATPQKLKHDVDLDTLPLVAFNAKIREHVKPNSFQGMFLSVQSYIFAPISCFLVGIFWTTFLHPRHIMRKRLMVELLSIVFRYASWVWFFTSVGYSFRMAMLLYLVSFGIGCNYIFTNFAVSHTHLDVTDADEYIHWVEYAGHHTTNVSTNSYFVTWWMSYLNFQIEHHLFPTMPQFRFPKLSHRVKELFEKHGITYDDRPYIQAMKDTFNNLHEVGNYTPDVKSN